MTERSSWVTENLGSYNWLKAAVVRDVLVEVLGNENVLTPPGAYAHAGLIFDMAAGCEAHHFIDHRLTAVAKDHGPFRIVVVNDCGTTTVVTVTADRVLLDEVEKPSPPRR